MLQHSGIELQLQGFFNRVRFTAFVARLLHHAKAPVVSLDMIVGALAVFPPQKDDHVVKLVCADLLQRFGQKGVGLIRRLVDQTPAARVGTWLADASFKEAIKLLVELPKQLEVRGKGQHELQVLLVLFTEVFLFTDDKILMVPDKGGLFFLAHACAALSLLLGFFAGTTTTLLAPFVALVLKAVFDRPHPVQDQLVHFFDDVKDTQLILDVSPVALEAVLVQGRAIGNDHLDLEPSIFERLEKPVHVGLIIFVDDVERYRKVPERIRGKQNGATTVVDFIKA